METPHPLHFVAERLKGGAWAELASLVMTKTVEPPAAVDMAYLQQLGHIADNPYYNYCHERY